MSWNHRIINHKKFIILSTLIFVVVIGCSTYTIPKESKVIVPQKDLASYNPKNFSKTNITQLNSQKKLRNEDQLIIQAIFLENQGAYKQSSEFYALLYDATQREEYLLKEVSTAHRAGITAKHLDDLKKYIEKNPDNIQAQRLLLSFYLKDKQFTKAKKIGNNLVQYSKQAVDFELAANPYIFTGDYKSSLKYLNEAYIKTYNEDILLKIVTIEINYLHNVEAAINTLEEHRQTQGCSEKICLQLIAIYAQQDRRDKLIPIYKALYQNTKKDTYAEKVIEQYLLAQDLNSAIQYLEEKNANYELLYSLYMEQKSYLKANKITKLLQKKTNNPKWYAESAISFYESLPNKNDKTQLKKVIQDFEKSIELGEKNPIYFNYYGYTLIDHNIDIQKGIQVIEQALLNEPENTYFLDSLAWGHYKLNNCEKAYPMMKKVVEVEGLNEEEIIEHWNAINNKCSK